MPPVVKVLLILGLCGSVCPWATARTDSTDPLPSSQTMKTPPLDFEPTMGDLEKLRASEIEATPRSYFGRTSKRIQEHLMALTEQSLRALEAIEPVTSSDRVSSLTLEQTRMVFDSIRLHPINERMKRNEYQRPNTDIGFCFGRAAFYHWLILKMGVAKQSLRKVWVLGNIQHRNYDWGNHVALMVKGPEPGQWFVLDPFFNQVFEARSWFLQIRRFTRDPLLRLYTSPAEKFSLNLGVYDPVQLGLRLDRSEDWYKGYFQDMLQWFREASPTSLGLPTKYPRVQHSCQTVHGWKGLLRYDQTKVQPRLRM